MCLRRTRKKDAGIVSRLEIRRFTENGTIIEGINPKLSDLRKMIEGLKCTSACGGTGKDRFILLEGDHRDNLKGYFIKKGFNEDAIGLQ